MQSNYGPAMLPASQVLSGQGSVHQGSVLNGQGTMLSSMYMINNQMTAANIIGGVSVGVSNGVGVSVSGGHQIDFKQELQKIQQDHLELKKKLSLRNNEVERLKKELKDYKIQCERYKLLIKQVNQTLLLSGPPTNPLTNGNEMGQNGQNRLNTGIIQDNRNNKKVKRHEVQIQSSGCRCCCHQDKPFTCEWPNCNKRFRQKPHLEAHRNIHTGRRFSCDWPNCTKSFVRKYNLLEHRKLHSQINPNQCQHPSCGKCFSSKYSLLRHQNVQHHLKT